MASVITSYSIHYTKLYDNLADRHDTHVSVAIKVIKAIRELPEETRPKHLYGCEVWRSLDWVNDDDRVSFGIDAHTNIAASLVV